MEWSRLSASSWSPPPASPASQTGLTQGQLFPRTSVQPAPLPPLPLSPCLHYRPAPTHPNPEAFTDDSQHHLWALRLGTWLWPPATSHSISSSLVSGTKFPFP